MIRRIGRHARHAHGSVLAVTLLVLLAITGLGVMLVLIVGTELDVAGNTRSGEQAVYYADAGLQEALMKMDDVAALDMGFGGNLTQIVPASGYADVMSPGGQVVPNAKYKVEAEPAIGSGGFTVDCNIPGFSLDFGQRRFHMVATGVGPSGTARQVEAIVVTVPQPGLCPPGLGERYP